MSASGPGSPDAELRIAVPFSVVIAAMKALARGDAEQQKISDDLSVCVPLVLLVVQSREES